MDYENNQDTSQNTNQDTGNYYEYQTPPSNNGGYNPPPENQNYPEPPKKGGAKKAIIITASIVLVVFLLLTGTVKVVKYIYDAGNGSQTEITQGDNSANGPIGSVELVSGGAIQGITDVSSVVDEVMPSIVAITQDYKQSYSIWGQTYDQNATGSGSGFIVDQDDKNILVVTNNHVVAGAEKITVTFIDKTTAEATVKGTDSTADLAVISIKLSDLKKSTREKIKVASLGSSDDAKVGQIAIAIGNALGYGQSVTVGYVSAKDRQVQVTDNNSQNALTSKTMTLLQTDAAINPGNSGGALLDMNGKVIGINSVKYASSTIEGMGYAIPISDAVPIINELMKREVLEENQKGYLGITGRTISSQVSEAYGIPVGIYVAEVADNGTAKEAGIKEGDVITKINDREVTTIQGVQEIVNSYAVGTEISITIKRSNNGDYEDMELKGKLKDSSTLDDLETGDNSQSGSGNPGSNMY